MDMMGIVFANVNDEYLGGLTQGRTIASVPIAGRYRIIDFMLSNLVNSGVGNVGIITKSNYQSLMDHLGNGKEWDLSRKKDGLFILPPFGTRSSGVYRGKLEALAGVLNYLNRSVNDYVVLLDPNVVCNFDYNLLLEQHIDSGADITMVVGKASKLQPEERMNNVLVSVDADKRVRDVRIGPNAADDDYISLNMYIIQRNFLIYLIEEAWAYNNFDFEQDIIQKKAASLKIKAYEFTGYCARIESIISYYKANMAMLEEDTRTEVFNSKRPIYTKVRDELPVFYGPNGKAHNCLIADGCTIRGKVENSIIFRGVHIGEGAYIKDSIIMQASEIGRDVQLKCCILDKEVKVGEGRTLVGAPDFPIVLTKRSVL